LSDETHEFVLAIYGGRPGSGFSRVLTGGAARFGGCEDPRVDSAFLVSASLRKVLAQLWKRMTKVRRATGVLKELLVTQNKC